MKIYLVWSIVYFFIDFIKFVKAGNASYIDFTISCIKSFVFTGSHFHFWFFPALFFSIIITTIVKYYKIQDRWLYFTALSCYFLGCLGCSYYNIAIHIPIISTVIQNNHFLFIRRVFLMAFPFFISGYWVFLEFYRSKQYIEQVSPNRNSDSTLAGMLILPHKSAYMYFHGLILILYLVEIFIVCNYSLQTNIFLTFMLLPLVISTFALLLKNPLSSYQELASRCRFLANFTYYSHPLFIIVLKFLFLRLCDYELNYSTELFLHTIILTMLSGLFWLRYQDVVRVKLN